MSKYRPTPIVEGALSVVPRMSADKIASVLYCDNGCAGGEPNEGLRKEASHYAFILGRRVDLCRGCAKAWPQLWADARDGVAA